MNRITPLILAVALFMEMMDSTVIATSLPAIAADLGTSPIALKLAMTAYLVALAIFIPISGWMADRFGARNVFRLAILIFMIGSVACAFSDSLGAFVLSRFIQGMGGSMMSPLARLILVRNTPRSELVNAWALLTIPALIGPIAGPPIGGFLTTFLSWHWIFWINIPIGILGIVASTIYLKGTGFRERSPLDIWGFALSGTSFACIIFGLSATSLPALPPAVGFATTIAGFVIGFIYVAYALRRRNPLLDPRIFAVPVFRTAIVSGTIFRIGVGAIPFLIPLLLQLGFGYSPLDSGLITFASALGALLTKFAIQRIYRAFGFRRTLIFSGISAGIIMAAMALFNPNTSAIVMILALFFSGYFRSLYFTGVNTLTFWDISDKDTGPATAIHAVAQQLSLALGIAVAAGILELSAHLRGAEIGVLDFQIALTVIGAISVLGTIPLFFLKADVGQEQPDASKAPHVH